MSRTHAVVGAMLVLMLVPLADASASTLRVRKEVRELTSVERRDFVQAVLALKATPSPYDPGLSYYDQFVAWHLTLSQCDPLDPTMRHQMNGHNGPVFLPWHRQFVLLFENALRDVSGKNITVPYWDWTDPGSVASVFAEDFMGGDGDPKREYAVTTGPFRKGNWELVVHPIGIEFSSSASPFITRRLGALDDLPTAADARSALAATLYDAPPYSIESDPKVSFRNAVEGWRPPIAGLVACAPDGTGVALIDPRNGDGELHNLVHIWVGGILAPGSATRVFGTMVQIPASVNDPIFFLHHANVDRLWAQWQQVHGVHTYRPTSGYPHNNADDVMRPFDSVGIRVTPASVQDTRALGYRYSDDGSAPHLLCMVAISDSGGTAAIRRSQFTPAR